MTANYPAAGIFFVGLMGKTPLIFNSYPWDSLANI